MRQRGGDHEHPVARQEGGQAVPGGARRAEGNPLQDDHPLLPLIGENPQPGVPITKEVIVTSQRCTVEESVSPESTHLLLLKIIFTRLFYF